MPRVVFLVSGRSGPSVRFRVDQFLPYLARRGVSAEIVDLHVAPAERRRLLRRARGYDAIVVHRALLDIAGLLCLRVFGGRFVYDFDDALMHDDSSHPAIFSPSRERRVARMVRAASRVIAGNRYLADWAAPRARAVSVVPTTIDVASRPAEVAPPPSEPIVGWIGTRVNLMYLRALLPALGDLARRRPQAKLKIVCDDFLDGEGIAVVKKPWSLADESSDLASFAVGIMPLPDDAWTRGKCALKILQYFAASRPVVCSPVGANLDIVEHGRNGFFAESHEEWVARLDELLADPEKRLRMGAEGRKTVAERYSTAGHVDGLLAAIGVKGARA